MSADNWTTCPRCNDQALVRFTAEFERVNALYGNVPIEEFEEARKALEYAAFAPKETFREDYEFYGAEHGEVVTSYSGCCIECGLTVDFEESKRFYSAQAITGGVE